MSDRQAEFERWIDAATAMAIIEKTRVAMFRVQGQYRIMSVGDARWLHRKGALTAIKAREAAERAYWRHVGRGIAQLEAMAGEGV